jgi:hypothetical protein
MAATLTSTGINFSDGTSQSSAGTFSLGGGYQKLPSGLLMQWGYSASWASVTFPIAFPSVCASVVSTYVPTGGNHEHGVTSVSTTGFTPVTNGNTGAFYWVAYGY